MNLKQNVEFNLNELFKEDHDVNKYLRDEIFEHLSKNEKTILNLISVFRYPVSSDGLLGTADVDYTSAQVTIKTHKSGKDSVITVKGSPITYSLAIPISANNRKQAIALIHYIFTMHQSDAFGYRFFKPRFFGSEDDFTHFKDVTTYAGTF